MKIVSYVQHATTQTVKIEVAENEYQLWEIPLEATNGICEFYKSTLM